jgi:hypothetical protein
MMQTEALKQPLWVAALLASTDSGREDADLRHRLRWKAGRASLRFTNGGSGPVFIPALGVKLDAGSRLDVRWPAGATAYEFRVERAA